MISIKLKQGVSGLYSRLLLAGGPVRVCKLVLRNIRKEGIKKCLDKIYRSYFTVVSNETSYELWIKRNDKLDKKQIFNITQMISKWDSPPLISVIMPVFNTRGEWLCEAIDSVRNQLYPLWQLCLSDDASTEEHIKGVLDYYAKQDSRIKVVYRKESGHISAASNSALELAEGEYVAFLDHDDLLPTHALFHVAEQIIKHRDVDIIYSDEDKITENGTRTEPHFKSGWNPDLFYSQNYICHLCVIRRTLVEKVGGFRRGVEGSQDHDLILRCLSHISKNAIIHVPRILYHWRKHDQSTASSSASKDYATQAGIKALRDHLDQQGKQDVKVEEGLVPNTYRVRWPLPTPSPLVSLLIPTRDRIELVENAVRSILNKTEYPNYEIIILDNNSINPKTIQYFQDIQKNEPRVRVISITGLFNFSLLNNVGVKKARGEVIGFINNDIEVISHEWLSEMVSHAIRPDIGCVGAKLYYTNETIQHGGVILGLGGVAGHSHKHASRSAPGYFHRLKIIQNLSAVTGACLVMRKSIFEEVGGFDDEGLAVAFNDVDLCIKVREAGYRNLWTPYAELYHHESLSRGYEDTPEKAARFEGEISHLKNRWGDKLSRDPFYNLNLTHDREDFSIS